MTADQVDVIDVNDRRIEQLKEQFESIEKNIK